MLSRLNRLYRTMAVLAVLAAACDATPPSRTAQVTGEVAVDFLLDSGELAILAVYPLEEWVGGAAPGELALRYELRGSGGAPIATGNIADPRVRSREGGPSEPGPRVSDRCGSRPSRVSS